MAPEFWRRRAWYRRRATGEQAKTMNTRKVNAATRLCVVAFLAAASALAQKTISAPLFGAYTAGDDYFLANYTQLLEYWNKVVKESDRIKLEEIGDRKST